MLIVPTYRLRNPIPTDWCALQYKYFGYTGMMLTTSPAWCTLLYCHLGYTGLSLTAPANGHLLSPSSQTSPILTSGWIPTWERGPCTIILTQGESSLLSHHISDRSKDWSERSRSVSSTSSQASNRIISIVPTPIFEPASSNEAEPEFQELLGSL